jgi:dCTP diphosphatase
MPRRENDSLVFLSRKVARFMKERDWDGYHSPKNLSMGLAIEAGELMEHFQWLTTEASKKAALRPGPEREGLKEEIADVLIYVLRLAGVCRIDLGKAVEAKLLVNARKYPKELVRGKSHKYTRYLELKKHSRAQ